MLSRTIRRLEPFGRHDAGFLSELKGLPWGAQDGIVRGRPRKEPTPPPPTLVGENTQKHNADVPDTADGSHSGAGKETDDTNDADGVPMSQTPSSDGQHGRSHSKAKSSTDDADGVRQRLKFDGEASGMTP